MSEEYNPERTVSGMEIEELKRQLAEAQATIRERDEAVQVLGLELHQAQAEINRRVDLKRELEGQKERYQHLLDSFKADREQAQAEIASLRDRLESAHEQLDGQDAVIGEAQAKAKSAENDWGNAHLAVVRLETQLVQQDAALAGMRLALEAQDEPRALCAACMELYCEGACEDKIAATDRAITARQKALSSPAGTLAAGVLAAAEEYVNGTGSYGVLKVAVARWREGKG